MNNKVIKLMTERPTIQSSLLSCGKRLNRTLQFRADRSELDQVLKKLGQQHQRGFACASHIDTPGRYYQYEMAIAKSALELTACDLDFTLTATSSFGKRLLQVILHQLSEDTHFTNFKLNASKNILQGSVVPSPEDSDHSEEQRTKRASIFTLLRKLHQLLSSTAETDSDSAELTDSFFGFYGLFGYDLVFQFEQLERGANRANGERGIHLFLPEILLVYEPMTQKTVKLTYRLSDLTPSLCKSNTVSSTLYKYTKKAGFLKPAVIPAVDYKDFVHLAMDRFAAGDLFEVVPSYDMELHPRTAATPYHYYTSLSSLNPSPYCFMVGTGEEHVIGASPEMYVRVDGKEVETCPISGTVPRGNSPLEDEFQIRRLLSSSKDTHELTMCTDVDRNDKSRICEPGSIQVKGRRMIEVYSHLIHTVDWVTGKLRKEFDALDAFITHMWAVTVTGAPKPDALQWIEDHEFTRRGWYGGAVGFFGFDGSMDTGLIIRTIRMRPSQISVRVGATLLHHSDPAEEEKETVVKAAAMLKAIKLVDDEILNIRQYRDNSVVDKASDDKRSLSTPNVLMIDHRDSFVHTLSDYFRQCGAQVTTLRCSEARMALSTQHKYDLVVLSPGPGTPGDFKLTETINLCLKNNLPIFGVCLGLQALVEYFGGTLARMDLPLHGEPSNITVHPDSKLFKGLPQLTSVGRYHSLYASHVPDCLVVSAQDSADVPMAVEHKRLKISAVQFHPESIMTDDQIGLGIIQNVLKEFTA